MSERSKSGLRLAGCVYLTLALIYTLFVSTGLLLGEGAYNQPMYRVVGACALVAIATLMFATVQHWVGWFLGVLCYLVLKTVCALLLFVPLMQPRLWFIEFGLLLGLAVLLCARYASREPQKIESAGLVGLVLALTFALECDSNNPLLLGVTVLTVIQLAYRRNERTSKLKAGQVMQNPADHGAEINQAFTEEQQEQNHSAAVA
jgi:hypothetical protein